MQKKNSYILNVSVKLLHSQCFSVFTEVFLFFVTYGTPTFASDIHFWFTLSLYITVPFYSEVNISQMTVFYQTEPQLTCFP